MRRRAGWLAAFLLLASVALLALGAAIGSTGLDSLQAMRRDPVAWQIVWDIRLPRTAGAWVCGALLGLAGAVAQGLFRNPLAEPYLLGSASGASLGTALALLVAGQAATRSLSSDWLIQLGVTGAAFVGAVLAVLLTLTLARGAQHTLRLLLGGVIVGVVLGAAKDLVTLAAPHILEAMQGFTLGSTAFLGWQAVVLMTTVLAGCLLVSALLAPVLDGLTLGEATAASLGLALPALRAALVAVLALCTATAVANTGLIAFVGLAAPHLVRPLVRVTHAGLLLLSAGMGGLLLMASDLLARSLFAPQELPVGVLTALLGGGYLLWLMHRRGGRR
ncbi:iron ABC transporter permease [Xylophilus sp. GOD-11R]|uniref:FecCD family ABC transporter permease n=1 Tax=Xylophilus sp. GOD-11R TaxID=3089814 RepID=UPI00298C68F8|nr:iron ABC transporter permease [Xylophilus sp. GOD-11R]WPB58557.1 iron ABC transporter permease [Xylophilus sp. GOD-11R]